MWWKLVVSFVVLTLWTCWFTEGGFEMPDWLLDALSIFTVIADVFWLIWFIVSLPSPF